MVIKSKKDYIYFEDPHSIFSLYYESPINEKGIKFNSAIQYILCKKCELFDDYETLNKILKLSCNFYYLNKVKNYTDGIYPKDVWKKKRKNIIKRANRLKFSQNHIVFKKAMLRCIKEDKFVYCAPYDKYLGSGLKFSEIDKLDNPFNWDGENVLGKILTDVKNNILENNKEVKINAKSN